MPDITLDDLVQSSSPQTVPETYEVTEKELDTQLAVLTPEERKQADELKNQIDVRDSQMLMQYGSGAKENIAELYAPRTQDISGT